MWGLSFPISSLSRIKDEESMQVFLDRLPTPLWQPSFSTISLNCQTPNKDKPKKTKTKKKTVIHQPEISLIPAASHHQLFICFLSVFIGGKSYFIPVTSEKMYKARLSFYNRFRGFASEANVSELFPNTGIFCIVTKIPLRWNFSRSQ